MKSSPQKFFFFLYKGKNIDTKLTSEQTLITIFFTLKENKQNLNENKLIKMRNSEYSYDSNSKK